MRLEINIYYYNAVMHVRFGQTGLLPSVGQGLLCFCSCIRSLTCIATNTATAPQILWHDGFNTGGGERGGRGGGGGQKVSHPSIRKRWILRSQQVSRSTYKTGQ